MHLTYHKVQYYETDMMQIVHHSNYIRWFEEARIDMLAAMGFPYAKMEEDGILIPVLSVESEYKKPCVFGETVCIEVFPVKYTGVKLNMEYKVWDEKRTELRTTGKSSHCFVDSSFNPISPKRRYVELDEALRKAVAECS
jgi:acyl-CoA thioester hydrolase